jgi:protease I
MPEKAELTGKTIAILAADDYEDLELWYPYYRMKEAGADVRIVGPFPGADIVHSKHGYPAQIDLKANQAKADAFDGVIVPGGWAPDRLRRCKATLRFVKELFGQNKVMAAICHGGWVLISADVIRGKRATSVSAIRDDMKNAGADWVDEEVVIDGNLITSRSPDDLPAFCREIVRAASA